jgi:hypothetical protein
MGGNRTDTAKIAIRLPATDRLHHPVPVSQHPDIGLGDFKSVASHYDEAALTSEKSRLQYCCHRGSSGRSS